MKPMCKGRVSFVIPAYNAAATIVPAVESCLAQTWRDCEVIVVDDGSRDDTACRLAPLQDRITVRHKLNGGVASARNFAMREATGEFIAWLDADDIAHPERVELCMRAMQQRPDVVLVSTDFSAFRDGEPDYEASHLESYYRMARLAGGAPGLYDESAPIDEADGARGRLFVGDAYRRLVQGNFVHFGTALLRRSAWERAGELDESLRYGCEYDHLIRVARLGRFAFIDRPLTRYRRSDGQLSHLSSGGRMPLDTIAVLDKLRREDPALARRERALLRGRYAGAFLEAAEMSIGAGRVRAAWLALRSLRHGPSARELSRVAAKVALPRSVVCALKKALVRTAPAAAGH
ncbi:MAG TPA: glycosyltransferase [Usitatibacter sp.]|nr:glycosyltransferase [Usitatibacter sp.]